MTTLATPQVATRVPQPRTVPLATLLAHEWRLLVRDRLLHVAASCFIVVVVLALAAGVRWSRAQQATVDRLRRADADQLVAWQRALDTIPADAPPPEAFARDPRSAFHVGARVGRVAGLDQPPLGVLAVGQSDLQPSYYKVTTGPRQAMLMNDEIENPVALLTGRLDLTFVIVALLPLLIGALSYGMLAGEREDGTLALVASQPVTLRRVLLAKVAVRAAIVLAVAIGLVAIGLVVAGAPLAAPGVATVAATWLLTVLVYAAFWFAIALLVAVLVRGAAAGALTLATVWLLSVIVVPVLVNVVAQARHPAPSRTALIAESRAAAAAANARADTLLRKFLFDHPEMRAGASVASGKDFVTRSLTVQFEVDTAMAPSLAAFDARLRAQQALVDRARLASPSLLAQGVLESLAGTDGDRWRRFRDSTIAYHRRWRDAIMAQAVRGEPLTAAMLGALPTFAFGEAPADAVLPRVGGALAVLVVLAVLAWSGALVAIGRVRAA
ncbi:MAG: DUF3526 domain-containing protein [Gemmatimonadaceae bacterium]|nr:DUF3526 domain-containing protein [Gemmatimonadaceae bacterium]